MSGIVTWTGIKLVRFQKAYRAARESGVDQFTFEGHEYVVDYAKYLIEYLEPKFFNERREQ